MIQTILLEISGKVHGVFFRATAKEVALANRISGWVKNTKEGIVEALITGEKNDLEEFISWCKKGPQKAKVDAVHIKQIELQLFDSFEILR